ncbi:4296_t:CDS:2, partial [Cetraspora pellucida]
MSKEFGILNEKLKTRTPLEIKGQFIDLFEFYKYGKLLPMLQATICVKGKTIRTPSITFTPRSIHCNLTEQQLWSFRKNPFTLIFADDSDFDTLDSKFKDIYFAEGISVKSGWIIDSKNQNIWVYVAIIMVGKILIQ